MAAPFEPVAAEAWDEGLVLHRAGWAMVVERLEALGALGPRTDAAKAADISSLVSLPATWRTLSLEHGWTYDEIEAWIVETVMRVVTEPSSRPRTRARRQGERARHTEGGGRIR